MCYCYLDHNIYIYALTDTSIGETVEVLKKRDVQFAYSPAHIEEIYTALVDNGKTYETNMMKLLQMISLFTNNTEFLPATAGIVQIIESPRNCFQRVKEYNTTERVRTDSQYKFQVDKDNYCGMITKDKHNQSISTISFDNIWAHPAIAAALNDLNQNMNIVVKKKNSSFETFLCSLVGVDKELPEDLRIEKGMYPNLINSHTQMEFVMEILFRTLSLYGYYSDKSESTTVSGTHDVSHAIYATKAQQIFTTDKRFAQRCKAIYYFLGIPTEVVLCAPIDISKELEIVYNFAL